MKRSLIFTFFILLFAVFAFPIVYTNSQDITQTEKKQTYELPYPGILPDNPLYILKASRDRGLEMMTREPMKKAELYLLLSDKRVRMAQLLNTKGKTNLAVSTISKAEKYFLKIPQLLRDSKTQGVKPSSEFVEKLMMSNAKHREVVQQLMKNASKEDRAEYQQVLDLNTSIKQELTSL
jgi:hypothetical protein